MWHNEQTKRGKMVDLIFEKALSYAGRGNLHFFNYKIASAVISGAVYTDSSSPYYFSMR